MHSIDKELPWRLRERMKIVPEIRKYGFVRHVVKALVLALRIAIPTKIKEMTNGNSKYVIYDSIEIAERWIRAVKLQFNVTFEDISILVGKKRFRKILMDNSQKMSMDIADRITMIKTILQSPPVTWRMWVNALEMWQNIVEHITINDVLILNRIARNDNTILAALLNLPTFLRLNIPVYLHCDYTTLTHTKRLTYAPNAIMSVQSDFQYGEAMYYLRREDLVVEKVVKWSFSKARARRLSTQADILILSGAEWARDVINERDNLISVIEKAKDSDKLLWRAHRFETLVESVIGEYGARNIAISLHPYEKELLFDHGLEAPYYRKYRECGVEILTEHEESFEYSESIKIAIGLETQSVIDFWAIGKKALMVPYIDNEFEYALIEASTGYSQYMALNIDSLIEKMNSELRGISR